MSWTIKHPHQANEDRHEIFVELVSGRYPDMGIYPNEMAGLQQYLDDLGVRKFTAKELARCKYPEKYADDLVGGKYLLPQPDWWPRAGAAALVLDRCRENTAAIRIAHWWRPVSYNRAVGGESGSDHITACAVDADFESPRDLKVAMARVIDPMFDTGLFEMSIGTGRTRLHLGMFAGRGQRRWTY
jgi:hypothetical protein